MLRLAAWSSAGLVGGFVIAGLLRQHHLIPDGLENILTLGLVVALFFACDAMVLESGLVAVTIASVVVANVKTRIHEELREFKEQLTQMLIGLLFVVRPLNVADSTGASSIRLESSRDAES
jgi:NhaP-type Na+/H+ or K+/H+ antiporter